MYYLAIIYYRRKKTLSIYFRAAKILIIIKSIYLGFYKMIFFLTGDNNYIDFIV